MQPVLSRIWTRVAVFISYDDNHYTTGTKNYNQYLQHPPKVQKNREPSKIQSLDRREK